MPQPSDLIGIGIYLLHHSTGRARTWTWHLQTSLLLPFPQRTVICRVTLSSRVEPLKKRIQNPTLWLSPLSRISRRFQSLWLSPTCPSLLLLNHISTTDSKPHLFTHVMHTRSHALTPVKASNMKPISENVSHTLYPPLTSFSNLLNSIVVAIHAAIHWERQFGPRCALWA